MDELSKAMSEEDNALVLIAGVSYTVPKGEVKPNSQPSPGPIGNTQGLILPKTSPNASGEGNSAPKIEPQPKEKGWWENWGSDVTHGALDVVGFIPVVGDVIGDGGNALLYAAEGDMVNAAISTAAMIPLMGNAAIAVKYAVKAEKIIAKQVEKAVVKNVEKEAVKQLEKKVLKEGGNIIGKASGTYKLVFKSGKIYIGKGLEKRMAQSIKRIESLGEVIEKEASEFFPAASTRQAFIKEYELMKETGELPLHWDSTSKLLNKIWSPGKKLLGE